VGSKRGALLVFAMLLVGTNLLVAPASAVPSAPPGTESGSSDWRTVSVGSISACGIRTTGRLYCWGYGGYLGDGGDGNTDQPVPTEVAGGHTTWRSVSVGGETTCAIRSPGRMYCWGNNFYGTFGNTTSGFSFVPTLVSGGFSDWTAVSAGTNATCGRRANGRLYCWGRDHKGQLGNGAVHGGGSTPRPVAGGFTDWTSVDAGGSSTCGRRANGRLYCWGENVWGQLGNGNQADRQAPTLVAGGFTDWTAVSAGSRHTCGLRRNAQLRCWGLGSDGQRGDGTTTESVTTPVLVSGGGWTHVSAGADHTCGRRNTGRLYCWGSHLWGQLGTGPSMPAVAPAPGQVAGNATDWSVVAAGAETTCARTRSGRLFCWGLDDFGELGNGSDGSDNSPSEVYAP
jgi:alpha-tubulin suppressor-like RCC1 family protein